MKPRYLHADTAGRDRWMISYLDVLTILLIFFVALAAHSLPPLQKSAPPAPPLVTAKPALEPHAALIRAQEALRRNGIDPQMEARGLVISLPQAILFPPGDDEIGPDARPVVKQIAEVLRDIPNQVSLIGHADAVPIHNQRFRNNWELSAARGVKLLELLTETYGIPESRLSVASDGANRPKSSNDTPDGRASNRRVEIVIQE